MWGIVAKRLPAHLHLCFHLPVRSSTFVAYLNFISLSESGRRKAGCIFQLQALDENRIHKITHKLSKFGRFLSVLLDNQMQFRNLRRRIAASFAPSMPGSGESD